MLMAVIWPKSCCALHVKCSYSGLHGVHTGGVPGVWCELSRTLLDNETVVWMFQNCTRIGECTKEGCTSVYGDYRLFLRQTKYILYDYLYNLEDQYLLSVCDQSMNLIYKSNLTSASNTITVSKNYSTLSTSGCSCDSHEATDDNRGNVSILRVLNIGMETVNSSTTSHQNDTFHQVSSYYSTTSSSRTAYRDLNSTGNVDLESSSYVPLYKEVNNPRMFPISLLAVVIPVSLLALMSSIGACCVGCRVNKPVPILPQSISFHRTNSSDMNSGFNLTSVTLHSHITPSHLVSSAHSLVDNSKLGEEESHTYETPDACLVGEKPPFLLKDNCPLLFPSDEEYRRADSGVQNYEQVQLEPEVYNKLNRIQLAPMGDAGGSARVLYPESNGHDASNIFYHTLDCNLADNARQIALNSL